MARLGLGQKLAEGEFVASYKFALLLSLAELSVECGDDSWSPLTLTTRELAERFIQYYWRQAVPYQPRSSGAALPLVLQQNTGRQAVVVQLLSDPGLRDAGTPSRACHRNSRWAPIVSEVARIVRVMPRWKLQTVGQVTNDFVYENRGRGSEIELRPGVAFCFRKFYGLVPRAPRDHAAPRACP